MKNLDDYHILYLKTDVNLLSDVFENVRGKAMKTYTLDPANYYTLPGYSWDVLLKPTNINLELITDVDMYLFIEKGLQVVFPCYHNDMEKLIIHTCKIMIEPNHPHIYNIWTLLIYMGMQSMNISQYRILNGVRITSMIL